jgi:hypothetical protein
MGFVNSNFWAYWRPFGEDRRPPALEVPGASTRIRVAPGDVATVIIDFVAEYNRHVEKIDHDPMDTWSFNPRMIRGTNVPSRHGGYAVDLRSTRHAQGLRGTYTARELTALRGVLAFYEGVIRWGGDYVTAEPDEMHYEIDQTPAKVAEVARKVRARQLERNTMIEQADITRIAEQTRDLIYDTDVNRQAGGATASEEKHLDIMLLKVAATVARLDSALARIEAVLAELTKPDAS